MITEVPPMAAAEPKRRRPPGMDPFAGELLDTVQAQNASIDARLASMEIKAERFANRFLLLFALGGLATMTMVGGLFVYVLTLFGESRDINTARAAESATAVISATSDAVTAATSTVTASGGTTTVTTTTPAPEAPAPTEE